jgi:hypothetical protein
MKGSKLTNPVHVPKLKQFSEIPNFFKEVISYFNFNGIMGSCRGSESGQVMFLLDFLWFYMNKGVTKSVIY